LNTIAIIPARGGSETIVDKNVVSVAGKPLIEYTIDAVKGTKCILDDTLWFVYTDRYRQYHNLGIIRPAIVSKSDTPMGVTVSKAIETYELCYGRVDNIILLQPNCPLLSSKDIDDAYDLFLRSGNDCLVSVVKVYNEKKYYKDGYPLKQGVFHKQEDRPLCQRNSAIFIFRKNLLRSRGLIFDNNPVLYEMPCWKSVDIDNEDDLFMAECLIKGGALSGT